MARRLRPSVRRSLSGTVVLCLFALVVAQSGPAAALAPTPVFAPYLNYDVGTARSVAVGDFTGDGRDDVVVSTEDSATYGEPDHVYLFAQGSDGWLDRVDVLETDLGWMPKGGLASGDLDGDGRTDAVVATGRSLDVFLQRNGGLADAEPIEVAGAEQVEVADVDGDRVTDLVTNGTGGVAVLRGLGGGRFAPPLVITSGEQHEVQVGDVTGDGRADLVTCGRTVVRVFAQLAGGTFSSPTEHPTTTFPCESLALADVDGDHRTDVSFVGGGNRPASRLAVLSQRSDGALAPAVSYPTRDLPGAVKPGDMNGDGLTDLVVLHESWMSAGVHAQAPDGSLDPERQNSIPYANGGSPKALAIGDINGDRRADIVIADDQHGLVVLWGQRAGPSTTTSSTVLPATVPTTAPPGAPRPLFSAFQSYDVHASGESLATGDFNGDGRTDVAMSTGFKFNPDTNFKLVVFYQGPDGSLQKAVRFDTEGGDFDGMTLASGDLDGDGNTDLVIGMRGGIDVFMQRGTGFADRKFLEIPVGGPFEVADMDRDGKGDLVVAGPTGLSVYRSLGSYTFAPPVSVRTTAAGELAVGDVTGDGRPDLLTLRSVGLGAGRVVVFRQLTDGSYAPAAEADTGGPPGTLTLGDFTGDGRTDVAVSHVVGDGLAISQIRILAQGADGTLAPTRDIDAWQPGPLRAGDVDGDGRADIVALYGGSHAGVLLQQANGGFAPEQTYPLPYATRYPSRAMVLADFTGDRRVDIGAANYNHGLDVLRNVATGAPAAVGPAGTFHALSPARVLDTRSGVGAAAAKLGPGATLGLQVAGRGGVPASGVSAVVLNVTVTDPTSVAYLTAWPSGEPRPLASNLNFVPGQTVPNLVVVKTGAGGKVDLFNSAGTTNVVADVAGWYSASTETPGAAYTALVPARILDTRTGAGAPAAKVGPGGTAGLQVTGRGGVPASGVSAVVLNVTVTEPTAVSYLTAWPSGEARPLASNLNVVPGQTVPNLVVVKVGAGGKVDLFNNAGHTHVIADVAGWYGADTTSPVGAYTPVTPARILDTRSAVGAPAAKVGPAGTLNLGVAGRGGVPASGVSAVVLNVTAVDPTSAGHVTVWPAGESRPLASNLNFAPGQTVPNLVVVKVGPDGTVNLFNSAGSTHLVADVAGWFAS